MLIIDGLSDPLTTPQYVLSCHRLSVATWGMLKTILPMLLLSFSMMAPAGEPAALSRILFG